MAQQQQQQQQQQPLISQATVRLITARRDPTRKAIYCDIAEWTNREMVGGENGEKKKRRRLRLARTAGECSSSSSSSFAAAQLSQQPCEEQQSCEEQQQRQDEDPSRPDAAESGGEAAEEDTAAAVVNEEEEELEYVFTDEDLSHMRELRSRRRCDGEGGASRRQLAEFQKASNLSRMFAKLIVRRTEAKNRRVLERLERMVQRRNRPLQCRHDRMYGVYTEHLKAYRQICPEFMGFLLRENVFPAVGEQHRHKSPYPLILLHLINATPSVTLSQFYFYVFGKNFCFGEVCEFFVNVCDSVCDSLFVQRTRFILQRYQHLGDGRATSILDKICICEMVLFPMLLRRKSIDDELELMIASNGTKLLNGNGACVAADELYERLHERTDVLDLAFQFVRDRVRRGRAPGGSETPRELYDELLNSREVLELSNFLHWRYDGSTYLDPADDELVMLRGSSDATLSKYIGAKYISFVKECCGSSRSSTAAATVATIDEGAGSAGCARGGGGRKKKSEGGAGSDIKAFHQRLLEIMELVSKTYRGSTLGGAANSLTGNGSGENASRESGQTTTVGGPTLDKFVRYMDKRTTHRIVLNLYLNRFELSTPAISRTLIINYDDGNPPQRYRFNEVRDRDINRFVHCALERCKFYFETVCSRDTLNHYLYSNVVTERASERLDDGDAVTAATGYNDDGENDDGESTSTATTSILRQFDRPFTCDVVDLVSTLPQMLSPRDACNILLHSHPFARTFAIMLLNTAHSFCGSNGDMLRNSDSVRRVASVLVEVPSDATAALGHLLYAPLGCRSYLDGAKTERLARDVFVDSRRFLRQQYRHRRSGGGGQDDEIAGVAATSSSSGNIDGNNAPLRNDADNLRFELKRRQSSLKIDHLSSSSSSSSSDEDDGDADNSKERSRRRKIKDLVSDSDFFVVPPQQQQRSTTRRPKEDADCPNAIRNYLASWRLCEFARDHASDPTLEHWVSSAVTSAKDGITIVNIAATFLFLLVRERERRTLFLTTTTTTTDDDAAAAATTMRYGPEETADRLNDFARLTDTRCSLFDDCYASLCCMYPECNIQSYDTNSLANGLTAYVTARPEGRNVPNDIAYCLSIALVSLHVFSGGDRDVVLFFLRYITAIRFPGQFFKTILLLQGTSDSGKSDFVSEVLRANFSCMLNGTLSNATLRQGIKDEVNTDLMSMMRSHVCQVDEPERMNAELFKNLVSTTMMKSRYFHQQQSQYLRNLAKIILTVNDAISLRSDAGVITRLKFCHRMVHQFKPLHSRHFDTRVNFGKSHATPSVCYQFATRCFAKGVNFLDFRTGLFLAIEHYGIDMCTYNEATYCLYDAISARLADVTRHDEAAVDEESKDRLRTFKSELNLFRKMLTFNLTDRVVAMSNNDDDNRKRRRDDDAAASKRQRLDDCCDEEDGATTIVAPTSILVGTVAMADDDCSSSTEEEDEVEDDGAEEKELDEAAAVNIVDVALPSALTARYRREEVKVARSTRFDAEMRNRSVKIFRDTASTKLDDPVLIDKLPDAMVRDAHNLHVMIDPFESLQQRYRIYEDSTVFLRDTDLYRFLRDFVEQSGYLVSRANFREIVIKIKERIKTDYPNAFDDKTRTFHLTFVPK